MGSTQSVQVPNEEGEEESEEEEEEEEEEEDDNVERIEAGRRGDTVGVINDINHNHNDYQQHFNHHHLVKKVLEQEPEILPCYASASPLSPQLSSLGTPRLGPSIKVWDPYNVLAPPPPLPPPPPPPVFVRSFSSSSSMFNFSPVAGVDDHDRDGGGGGGGVVEVFLICHGECELSLRPDLVGGRCHTACLTPNGKRQARALAVFLNSQGVSFGSVYCSPLDRARSTAAFVCREMHFPEDRIQSSDALAEISMGHWEGCSRSEIYTPEIATLIESSQPDFCAPSGESLRQVEFRMVQFLNGTILGLEEKLRTDLSLHQQNDNRGYSHERDGPSLQPSQWDMLNRHRQGLPKKTSGKSRLQVVSSVCNDEGEDEISPREANHQKSFHDPSIRNLSSPILSCIGVFTHSVPIKCLLTGLLGCSPLMSYKICIEDSSVTVLQHSLRTGWQIKRLNDTAHLRLL